METKDIRWQQRFSNYQKALKQLKKIAGRENLDEIEMLALVQSFEIVFELAWKTLRDFLIYQTPQTLLGSRDVFRTGFQTGILKNGQLWMQMLDDRNLTSHTYDEFTAKKVTDSVVKNYLPVFLELELFFEDQRK